jgi:hypothetical protein
MACTLCWWETTSGREEQWLPDNRPVRHIASLAHTSAGPRALLPVITYSTHLCGVLSVVFPINFNHQEMERLCGELAAARGECEVLRQKLEGAMSRRKILEVRQRAPHIHAHAHVSCTYSARRPHTSCVFCSCPLRTRPSSQRKCILHPFSRSTSLILSLNASRRSSRVSSPRWRLSSKRATRTTGS